MKCALCPVKLTPDDENACLDHDHITGDIRGVLCRNCNQMEGKVHNCSRRAKRDGTSLEWLKRLVAYIEYHKANPSGIWYYTHKTADEKRLLKNKRARKARKKAKENASELD